MAMATVPVQRLPRDTSQGKTAAAGFYSNQLDTDTFRAVRAAACRQDSAGTQHGMAEVGEDTERSTTLQPSDDDDGGGRMEAGSHSTSPGADVTVVSRMGLTDKDSVLTQAHPEDVPLATRVTEDINSGCSAIDSEGRDTHSYPNSLSDIGQHADQEVLRSSKKHVAWQTDREMDIVTEAPVDRDDFDPLSGGIDVDSVEHTAPTGPGLSSASIAENKGLKDPENIITVQDNDGSTPGEELNGKERLNAQEQQDIRDRRDKTACVDNASDTLHPTHDRELQSSPKLQDGRRPASASSVGAKSGRLLGDRSLSEEALRRFSANAAVVTETRRFSLPLDHGETVSSSSWRELLLGDKREQESKSPGPGLPGFVRDVENQTRAVLVVTCSENEQTKPAPDARKDSPDLTDKPPRLVSSKNKGKTRQRPHTAGPARVTNRRPVSRPSRVHSAPAGTAPPRPWEVMISKEELQRALPRRNFFSCHNKALKDAGFEVEEENARPRRRRLLFFHHEDETKKSTEPSTAGPPVIHVPPAAVGKENGLDDGVSNVSADQALETAVQALSFHDRAKRRRSNAPPQVVECKPLQLYLSYVSDNPGEYRHMVAKSSTSGAAAALHPSSQPADNCHTARLVSMGRIFQARHGGARMTDEVLRAAYSLNPRAADPNRFATHQRDKSALAQGLLSRKPSVFPRKESAGAVSSQSGGGGEDGSGGKSGQRSKPGSESSQKHDAEKQAQAEHLLEVEKRRLKAEDWARTVTTEQLLRAKLHVLKELGHEERELSQWWLAFRTCFYLRSRIRE